MAGEIAFFEIGVEDFERGRAFYEGLFGWTFEPAPTEGYTIRTPSESGGMHGGDAGASPYLFFAVDDIDAAVARVVELGGETVHLDLDGDQATEDAFGRFQLCKDDQGSTFGLHQRPTTG